MKLNLYKKTDNSLIDKKHYEIFIFAILMLEFVILCPGIKDVNSWAFSYYFLSYQDLGFNSRLLIGSVFKLFSDYISLSGLYWCIIFIATGMNAFVAVILGKVLRRSTTDKIESLEVFIALFLASPVSLSFLFGFNNFGRLDMYLIIFTIMMMICLKNRILKWFIPLLCIFAMATHQGYFLLYFPAIMIMLIYELYKNKFSKTYLLLCLATIITAVTSFLYFQFLIPELNFKNAADVVSFLSHRTDYAISLDVIYIEYFANIDTWFFVAIELLKAFAFPYGLCMLVATAPLIIIFLLLWRHACKKADDKFSKLIILLCITAPAFSLPLFIGNDWDRWIPAIFLTQFMLLFYFFDSGFFCVVESAKKIHAFFHIHYLIFLIVIICLASFIFSDTVFLIFYFMQKVLVFFSETLASYHA